MARARALQCPFCETHLRAPIEINFKDLNFTGGICPCRAVYVLDESGRALGEVFLDALAFVCRGDIDRSLQLDPDEYETVELDYDQHANTIGRRGSPAKISKLLFVRLKEHDENKA